MSTQVGPVQVSNCVFAGKLLVVATWILSAGAGAAELAGIGRIGCIIALGLAFVHAVELQHQALHYTGFSRRPWNRYAGFVLGLPMLVSFSAYQAAHLKHHERLGTPGDREFFDYGDLRKSDALGLLSMLFMVRHFADCARRILRSVSGREMNEFGRRRACAIRSEYRLMGLVLLAASIASVGTGSTVVLDCWLFPLIAIAAPVHVLVEIPEHYGCRRNSPDVFQNTRTIRSNRLMTWFTNGNNLHVEHHWKMNLPMHRLAELRPQTAGRVANENSSYCEFYAAVISDIRPSRRNANAGS
ncbi:MAG: hypothetical protein GC202_08040 [Alphaproteobacteria bacterium]|nr:hypothetical protein [Alphaproteobacteria bacterium]